MRALLALVCAGCIQPNYVTCGDGICPVGDVCSTDLRCISPAQVSACASITDGERCTFGDSIGFCHHGACVTTLNTCGDGVSQLSLDEQCDCGSPDVLATPPAGCNGFNSDMPGATCRASCKPATCGDSIVDTNELCDDGNTISGDGCRADCQGRFAKQQTPIGYDLYSLLVLARNDAYAFGASGAAVHWDGTSWSAMSTGFAGPLRVAWGRGPSDIYVAGETPSSHLVVLHYDGNTWAAPNDAGFSNGAIATGLYVLAPNDIYLAAQGSLLHYDGTWSSVTTPCGTVNAVVGSGSGNIYAGGAGLCRYTTSWTKLDPGFVSHLSMRDQVVLASTEATMQLWLGSAAVQPAITIPGYADTAAITGSDEVIVAGLQGLVLQLDKQGNWTHLVVPTEVQLNDVAGTDPTNVFIVGMAGTILH